MRKLSFVLPCYGSEKTIFDVVSEIKSTVRLEDEYEIILVNDCSPDNVWNVIQRICQEEDHVKGINLAKNFGQHAALMAGYRYSDGDIVISLDDDGQTPAGEVYKLLDQMEQGYDVVFATYAKKQHNKFRNLGSRVNTMMAKSLAGMPENIQTNSYFCMKRFVVNEILRYQNSYPYIAGLIFRVTRNIGNIEVIHKQREQGQSGYNIKKLFSLWLNGFTAFSVKPLRIATLLGFFCSLFGFLFGCTIIIRKLLDPSIVSGWSSIVALLVFIGGVIMIMLGLIGEYIGRIYICINNNPQYVVKEVMDKINT